MIVKLATQRVQELAQLLHQQKQLVEKTKAAGADTTEAEHVLGLIAAAYLNFQNCLERAIRDRQEKDARDAINLSARGVEATG